MSRANYQHGSVTIKLTEIEEQNIQNGMISRRVRPPSDGLPVGDARLSWTLDINTWGCRRLPKCRRRPSGVWCGGKISTRRRVRGCCWSCTCVQTGMRWLRPLRPSGGAAGRCEHPSCCRASCLTAQEMSRPLEEVVAGLA